jgi:hypothetical protein
MLPHKKPPNKELSKKKDDENVEFGEFRGDIERVFGKMVTIFESFKNSYRYGDAVFNIDFKCIFNILYYDLYYVLIIIVYYNNIYNLIIYFLE